MTDDGPTSRRPGGFVAALANLDASTARADDGTGMLCNWWTDEDREVFDKRDDKLVAQYEAFDVTPNEELYLPPEECVAIWETPRLRNQSSGLHYIRYGYNVRAMAHQNSRPLTPAVLHILLALSTRERHGYGIMKQVEGESQGKVTMGPGTLYGSLGRMIDAGLICESDKRVDPELDDERRVYYEITRPGREALARELERYREVVAVARRKSLVPRSAHG